MKTKKIVFLVFFLNILFSINAQSADNHRHYKNKEYCVLIETDYGNMIVKLYNETPNHRDNFLKLVNDGVYDSLLFHRVINHFMIQGGDPNSRNAKPGQMLGDGTLGYNIPAEFDTNLIHKKGALAAAREGDEVNPTKASSASQFYLVQGQVWNEKMINMMQKRMGRKFSDKQIEAYSTVGGTPHLDGEYTVFGEVIDGIEVIDKIAAVPCDRMDRPIKDVRMKMKVLKKKELKKILK